MTYNMMIGKPPEDVIDRESEVGRILKTMTDKKANANFALIGHRRIGKSTILHKVKRELEESHTAGCCIPVYVDLGEYRYSPVELAEVLTEELTRAYAKGLSKASQLLSKITSSLGQLAEIRRLRARFLAKLDSTGQPTIEIDPYIKDRDSRYDRALDNFFEYANRISEASKKRVVIMIDEFQHITEYSKYDGLKNILDFLRAVLERRKNVSFIVSGSRIHYLRNILGEGGSPLFGHFVIIEVKPLAKKYAIELFTKSNPRATAQDCEDAYALVDGHPFYLVMLAEAQGEGEPVKETYRRILTSTTGALYLYVNYIVTEDLPNYKSTNYRRVLESLASGEKTISELAKDADIRLTHLPRLLTKLIEYDLVSKEGGRYFIADKVVRDYFKMRSQQ